MSTLRQIKGDIFTFCTRSRVQNLKWGLPLEQFDKWYGLEWLGCEAGAGSTPGTLSIFGQRKRAVAKWARRRQRYHLFPHDHVQRQASQPEMWVWVCVTHWQHVFVPGGRFDISLILLFLVVTSHLTLSLFRQRRFLLEWSFFKQVLVSTRAGGSLWHKAAASSLAPNLCPWFLIYLVSTCAFACFGEEK